MSGCVVTKWSGKDDFVGNSTLWATVGDVRHSSQGRSNTLFREMQIRLDFLGSYILIFACIFRVSARFPFSGKVFGGFTFSCNVLPRSLEDIRFGLTRDLKLVPTRRKRSPRSRKLHNLPERSKFWVKPVLWAMIQVLTTIKSCVDGFASDFYWWLLIKQRFREMEPESSSASQNRFFIDLQRARRPIEFIISTISKQNCR